MYKDFVLPEWAKNAVIYEVNLRQYTEEGTIKAFQKHLPRLKDMGIKIIWLMPIFPIGATKRKGPLGSYYSVTNYTEVNPEFGNKEDMKDLIHEIHRLDMKIILDWVPKHTAWDHSWVTHHPEFYQKNKNGEITDPLDWSGNPHGWEDVAGLNYNNKDLRKAKISQLCFWIHNFNIDGYRMDIAYGVPLDFWKECAEALVNVKEDIFLLAEADSPDFLNENAFHCVYGWKLHHTMNMIGQGKQRAWDIDAWLHDERVKYRKGNVLHFITNHDENSWNGTEMERMGHAYKPLAVLAMTLDGIPLIYNGQEEPLTKRLKFFDKDNIEFKHYALGDFYKKLCHLKLNEEALWNEPYGARSVRIADSADVYAFKREKGSSKVVVIMNLSSSQHDVFIKENLSDMYNVFTGEIMSFNVSSPILLGPWSYIVLTNKDSKYA